VIESDPEATGEGRLAEGDLLRLAVQHEEVQRQHPQDEDAESDPSPSGESSHSRRIVGRRILRTLVLADAVPQGYE
jgi:hypothetical protein